MTNFPDEKCRQDNVYFLKMPKTGSTTLFGILNRVVLRRNLRITTYDNIPFWSEDPYAIVNLLKPKFVVGKSRKFNMHGVHSRYDREAIQQALYSPHANVTFFRHPFTRTRSNIYHLGLQRSLKLKGPDPLVDFLYNINDIRKTSDEKINDRINRTGNRMTELLRINRDVNENSMEFLQSLREIERTFVFGLTEHYIESLVLLRRRLCWSLRDVIHVPIQVTAYRGPPDSNNTRLRKLACVWSNLDCRLYDYFNRSFWEAVGKEGPGFQDEVARLNQIQNRTYHYCTSVYKQLKGNAKHIAKLNEVIPPLVFEKSEWNEEFDLGVFDCAMMRIGAAKSQTLSFYLQNEDQCEPFRHNSNYGCRFKHNPNLPICKDICLANGDTETMLRKFLEYDEVYIWK